MKKFILFLLLMASPAAFCSETKKKAEVKTDHESILKDNRKKIASIIQELLSHNFPQALAQLIVDYNKNEQDRILIPRVFICALNPELALALNKITAIEMDLMHELERTIVPKFEANKESKINTEEVARNYLKSFLQEVQRYEACFVEIAQKNQEFSKKASDKNYKKRLQNYLEDAGEHGVQWPHKLETLSKAQEHGFIHEPTGNDRDRLKCKSCKFVLYPVYPWTQFNREHTKKCKHLKQFEPLTKESLMYHLCAQAKKLAPQKKAVGSCSCLSTELIENSIDETQEAAQKLVNLFDHKAQMTIIYYVLKCRDKFITKDSKCTIS